MSCGGGNVENSSFQTYSLITLRRNGTDRQVFMQNIGNEEWELDEVSRRLQKRMHRAVDAVTACWRELAEDRAAGEGDGQEGRPEAGPRGPHDLRTAALVVAVRRLARATLERGIWP